MAYCMICYCCCYCLVGVLVAAVAAMVTWCLLRTWTTSRRRYGCTCAAVFAIVFGDNRHNSSWRWVTSFKYEGRSASCAVRVCGENEMGGKPSYVVSSSSCETLVLFLFAIRLVHTKTLYSRRRNFHEEHISRSCTEEVMRECRTAVVRGKSPVYPSVFDLFDLWDIYWEDTCWRSSYSLLFLPNKIYRHRCLHYVAG